MLLRSDARSLGPGNYVLSGPLPPATRAPRGTSAPKTAGTNAGDTNATATAQNATSPDAPAGRCPTCGRLADTDQAPSSPPPRRSPRNFGKGPLLKRNGARNGRTVLPTGVQGGRISKRFPKVRTPYTKGFANPDALSCYRNAPLQCLLHIPAFYNYLGNIHKDCIQTPDRCTVCALQNLAHVYWNAGDEKESAHIATVGEDTVDTFNAACIAGAPGLSLALQEDFENGRMSDPYEFACYIAAELRGVQNGDECISAEAMLDTPRVQKWVCRECGFVNPIAGIGDLGIGLQTGFERVPEGDVDLTESLRLNTFSSIDARRCNGPECVAKYGGGADVRVVDEIGAPMEGAMRAIKVTLTQLPEVLVIRISRFRHDDTYRDSRYSEGYYKDDRIVRLQEYLSLQSWSAGDQDHFTYRLDGIVGHGGAGESVNFGHYVAAVRKIDGTFFELVNDNYQIEERTFEEFQDKIDIGSGEDEEEDADADEDRYEDEEEYTGEDIEEDEDLDEDEQEARAEQRAEEKAERKAKEKEDRRKANLFDPYMLLYSRM